MIDTIALSPRGRPSVTRLQEELGRARLVNVSLREQLHAERREGVAFAERVRSEVVALRRGLVLDRADLVEQSANAIGYAAARHLRQRAGAHL